MNVKFVNCLVFEKFALPVYRTWHVNKDYAEDPLYRGERPTVLHLLELVRLENYKLTRIPTVNRDLHIYVGDLAAGTRAKDMLLRRLAHSKDTMSGGLERTLNKALDAIDIARMDSKAKGCNSTRIYINYLSEVSTSTINGKVTSTINGKVQEIEFTPEVEIHENNNGIDLRLEIPGLDFQGLGLQVNAERVEIKGKNRQDTEVEEQD